MGLQEISEAFSEYAGLNKSEEPEVKAKKKKKAPPEEQDD